MRIVIVGYGPGGAAAALTARMFNSEAEIKIITEETIESHRKPGAAMALEFPDTEDLKIKDWSFDALSKNRIEILSGTVVTGGDAKTKTLQLDGSKSIEYDKLILATGGIPAVPELSGTDLAGVHTIQTMADTSVIGKQLSEVKCIMVVGAGFSGLETAERLIALGKEVHLVVRSRLMRKQLEESMSEELLSRLSNKLVVHTGVSPKSVEGDNKVESLLLEDKSVTTDAVLFMTGVRPNTKLAEALGLKLGKLGGIVVDEKMMTSDSDILAVGDCVELKDPITNDPFLLPIASVAARAGRQAGVIAAGGSKIYDNTIRRLQYDHLFNTDIVVVGHSSVSANALDIKTKVQYWEDPTEFAKVALVTTEKGQLIGGQVISSRMGAKLGYEILDRVESYANLKDKPLLRPRHERLREYLESTFGPIR
ncbi:MAG: FAD-dependent oxidoreductase [Candidatus Thorarchaeota archaeon]|jgi:NADPH-dependent 2,4-dienoyl-CoA reductase/sulfur reductase-like enzyme